MSLCPPNFNNSSVSPDDAMLLKDSLDCVRNWMKEINEDRGEDVRENRMTRRAKGRMHDLYKLICEMHLAEQKEILADQIAKEGGYTFTEYLKGLTAHGKYTPSNGYNFACCKITREVCWNYSDASLEFCVELGRNGMFRLAVADLNNFWRDFYDAHIRQNIILPNLHILHNCAKAPGNKKYMKEAEVIGAILPYTKVSDKDVKIVAMMTLAYIIDEKNNHIISADKSIIKFILTYLENALKSEEHKYRGFSPKEIVAGLLQLASNDDNKIKIADEGILPMLVEMMQKGDEDEKAISAETVWILSFAQENMEKIRHQSNMIETLKKLSNSEGSRNNNASGALWILENKMKTRSMEKPDCNIVPNTIQSLQKEKIIENNEVELSAKSFSEPSPNSKTTEGMCGTEPGLRKASSEQGGNPMKHIMLSYQWDCQDTMLKIKSRLEQNYKVWMDVDAMGGSTLQAMAEAVENSAVILFTVSQKYKDSANCRTEAEYAYKKKKTLIPLLVESDYEADGWLGAIQGASYYYNFINPDKFESVFSKLFKDLEVEAKPACIMSKGTDDL